MKEIPTDLITKTVRDLFIKANHVLPEDMLQAETEAYEKESSIPCKMALRSILDNLSAAKEMGLPICQDTGMAILFIEMGQEVHITGGSFEESINEGVRLAYKEGYLRKSVVQDPLKRGNTEDNTPAIIHFSLKEGDKLRITAAPKGFGSENMSRLKMFTPSATEEDIIAYIQETVLIAGSQPCPPIVIGVGLGGDFEECALLAKKALIRPIGAVSEDPFYAGLEQKALAAVNRTNIGAQGFGGKITALAVHIETYPTHIAGLPVAVNIGCHVNRHVTAEL